MADSSSKEPTQCLKQGLATLSLLQAALAIHNLIEGHRKKKYCYGQYMKQYFLNLKSITGIHLKLDNNCISSDILKNIILKYIFVIFSFFEKLNNIITF
jgi:hypothetical protein